MGSFNVATLCGGTFPVQLTPDFVLKPVFSLHVQSEVRQIYTRANDDLWKSGGSHDDRIPLTAQGIERHSHSTSLWMKRP